jgi:hypothetical protein
LKVRLFLALAVLLMARAAWAGPLSFDLELHVPPVIADSQAPLGCTVTYMIEDTSNGDLFAQRMQIASAETDQPVDHKLPCPANVSSRLAAEALQPCLIRATDPKTCVYADMARGFERQPDIRNTAENASRCRSDQASHIGVACWMSGALPVCDVACGQSPIQAASQARARCEDKQQRACPIAGSVPVALDTLSAPVAQDGGK